MGDFMGWSNYIVIPKAKLLLTISRSVDQESCEELEKELYKLPDYDEIYTGDWTPENISKQKLETISTILAYHRCYSDFDIRDKLMFIFMKCYDDTVYVISGLDKKLVELENGGYVKL